MPEIEVQPVGLRRQMGYTCAKLIIQMGYCSTMSDVIQTIKPQRTRVKFCGITNLADALHAEALGVDAIGFVFNQASPRYIKPTAAKEIINKLPPFITSIGLFVNESQENVAEISNLVGLSLLQFHGDETPEYCNAIGKPFIKAIRVQSEADILNGQTQHSAARALLLDSFNKSIFGGTGEAFDW